MPDQGTRAIAYGASALGALLLWSGFTGKSWSAALETLIYGQDPRTLGQQYPIGGITASTDSSTSGGGSAGGDAAANKQLGQQLAAKYGWGSGVEWNALVSLWDGESGWSRFADTRKSGLDPQNASVFAYGIPQSRPYSKMPKSAWPEDKGGQSNASAQINWGLDYIKHTYGSPSSAAGFKARSGNLGY